MANSNCEDFGVAGMSLLNPSCLDLNKKMIEMDGTLDQVLADVQRDISNLKVNTTGIEIEISGLNSNLNGLRRKQAGPECLPNGDTNELTVQERKVIEDWPEADLPSQAHLYGETNLKNKINFKHETKLSIANHRVLRIQGVNQDQ
ncbi:hypothetical protein K3495_g573 [Podosphaera aphanis]|nr:hypothetical protein K3495_g573 [Podosphaera aphanis]